MAISKTKTYLVLNYNPSPVAVKTKNEYYMIEGGASDEQTSLPLDIDEISVINSNSPAFKIGLLRFEPEYETAIYEELRIANWKDILTDAQIEDIVLHPTMESLQKILDIENEAYFERIRGVYTGLKNAGADISNKVEKVIESRRVEFVNKVRKSKVKLVPNISQPANEVPTQEEFNDLKSQLAAMQEMMAKLSATSAPTETPKQAELSEGKPATKPATRKTNQK